MNFLICNCYRLKFCISEEYFKTFKINIHILVHCKHFRFNFKWTHFSLGPCQMASSNSFSFFRYILRRSFFWFVLCVYVLLLKIHKHCYVDDLQIFLPMRPEKKKTCHKHSSEELRPFYNLEVIVTIANHKKWYFWWQKKNCLNLNLCK